MKKIIYFILGFFLTSLTLLQAQTVSTFAGSGSSATTNGIGAAAAFQSVTFACLDNNGNMYVVDGKLIRKIVISTSAVSTLAGFNYTGAYQSVDGAGTNASFNSPYGICFDGSNNLYVTDSNIGVLRRINLTTLQVTTISGSNGSGYVDGALSNARYRQLYGITCVGGNTLYVSDGGNHCIRKIDLTTNTVSIFAGTVPNANFSFSGAVTGVGTAASFNNPIGIKTDNNGNLFVADIQNHKIRQIVIASAVVSTIAGTTNGFADGNATTVAKFSNPSDIAVDAQNNIYVSDSSNNRIRKISNGVVSTLAGTGTSSAIDGATTVATFSFPQGIVIDGTNTLYVCDTYNRKIRKIALCGTPAPTASAQSFCSATTIGNLVATGTAGATLNWYAAASGGAVLAPNTAISSSGSYYVSQTPSGECESSRTAVTVTIATPDNPSRYETMGISGYNSDIIANGSGTAASSTTKRFDDMFNLFNSTFTNLGTPTRSLPASGSFFSQTTPTLPFQIYGAAENNSVRLDATFVGGSPQIDLQPKKAKTVFLLAASGNGNNSANFTIRFTDNTTQVFSNIVIEDWFFGSNKAISGIGRTDGSSLFNQGAAETDPNLYQYALALDPSNYGKTLSAILISNINLVAPSTATINIMGVSIDAIEPSAVAVCANTPLSSIAVNGTNVSWFATATSTTALPTTTILQAGTTYFAQSNAGSCNSARIAFPIIAKTTAPIATATQTQTTGAIIASLVATGSQIQWYAAATGGTALATSTALVNNTTYYASQTIDNCESMVRAAVAVSLTPGANYLNFKTNDRIRIANNYNNSTFTIEMRIRFSNNQSQTLLKNTAFLPTGPKGFFIETNASGKLRVGFGDPSNEVAITSANAVNSNVWQSVAFVKSGTSFELFLNGISQISGTINGFSGGLDVYLGYDATNSSTKFQGDMDEVRFWNVARTQAQIVASAGSDAVPATTSGLVALYNFNQGIPAGNNPSVTTLVNSLSGGTNGTLENFTLNSTASNWLLDSALAITGFENNIEFSVFPNPSTGVFTLKSDFVGKITVYSVFGQELISTTINQGESILDLSGFANGMYLVKITNSENQTKTLKVLKQ